MKKIKNIIWILVDSVRNYHTDKDDRGRLDVMDKFALKSVEFETAITSAPSTVMSVCSMMTGIPSIYHSRTYKDFDYQNSDIATLPQIMDKEGYNAKSVIFFPEGRRFLKPIFVDICEEYWTKDANPKDFWSNQTVFNISKNILDDVQNENNFIYFHFNCRHDPHTSEIVADFLALIEEKGYFENSIIVLNSDHGYPDPSRKISFQDRAVLGHDLIMTDDNILTPVFIYYPECVPKKIKFPVSTLDIMPTVLSLCSLKNEYKIPSYPIVGRDLSEYIFKERTPPNSMVRSDNRFIFQDYRVVSLRDSRYKLIRFIDDKSEMFFDLKLDPEEMNNEINNLYYKENINSFRNELCIQEEHTYSFHKGILKIKIMEFLHEKKRYGFLGKANITFYQMAIECMIEIGFEKVYLIDLSKEMKTKIKRHFKKYNRFRIIFHDDIEQVGLFDNLIVPIVDNNLINNRKLLKQSKIINAKNVSFINLNFKPETSIYEIKRLIFKKIFWTIRLLIKSPKDFIRKILSYRYKIRNIKKK